MRIGQLVLDVGYGLFMPIALHAVGTLVPQSQNAGATALVFSCTNLASFAASPLIQAIAAMTGDPILMPIYAGIGIFALLGIVCFMMSPLDREAGRGKSSPSSDNSLNAAC